MAEVTLRPVRPQDAEAAYGVVVESNDAFVEPELALGMFSNLLAIGKGSVAETAEGIEGVGVVNREFGRIWVRPSARRRGTGTRLLHALERDTLRGVLHFAASANLQPAAAPFLAANGYRKAWEIWFMGIDVADETREPAWPDGVTVRTFREEDAQAVKALLDEAYSSGEPDYVPLPFDDWRTFMLGDPNYDPDAWFLAVEGDEIVGAVLNWDDGYVKDLVVSPRARRRGLGKALMLQTFQEFRGRGVPRVTLKTDSTNPTDAGPFYERLGMEIERTYEVFGKSL